VYECYIEKFLVRKAWVHQATEALFSTTQFRFETSYTLPLFPRTCMGLQYLKVLHLYMHDAVRYAAQIALVCHLREMHVLSTGGDIDLTGWDVDAMMPFVSPRWSAHTVFTSPWFRALRPLSGLKKVSITVNCIPPDQHHATVYDDFDANVALVKLMLEGSATRPYEEPQPIATGSLLELIIAKPDVEASFELGVRLLAEMFFFFTDCVLLIEYTEFDTSITAQS
jgi:hypothetical protein